MKHKQHNETQRTSRRCVSTALWLGACAFGLWLGLWSRPAATASAAAPNHPGKALISEVFDFNLALARETSTPQPPAVSPREIAPLIVAAQAQPVETVPSVITARLGRPPLHRFQNEWRRQLLREVSSEAPPRPPVPDVQLLIAKVNADVAKLTTQACSTTTLRSDAPSAPEPAGFVELEQAWQGKTMSLQQ